MPTTNHTKLVLLAIAGLGFSQNSQFEISRRLPMNTNVVGVVDEPKRKEYGPRQKGKKGKTKRW